MDAVREGGKQIVNKMLSPKRAAKEVRQLIDISKE